MHLSTTQNNTPPFIPSSNPLPFTTTYASLSTRTRTRFSSSASASASSSAYSSHRPLRYAVLGAGFAGLSVAWHLLQLGSKELHLLVDIYDEVGVGGGASGVAGGLLHPYSPKVKPLWEGAEFWKESLNLLKIAEDALINNKKQGLRSGESPIIRRRGILRPAIRPKSMSTMIENARDSLATCRIESIGEDAARNLVPDLSVPLGLAFHMPEALNINVKSYLQGLFSACENLVKDKSILGSGHRELRFVKEGVHSLQELAAEYDAVIICLGARTAFLPELSGKVPIRTCRGVIAHLELADQIGGEYPGHSPSILSDAWLAVHGARHLDLGSTWDWNSKNYSRDVSSVEASKALEVLLPKASTVYPAIKSWTVAGAIAGLRAMPPLTSDGSLPLLGCVDEYINGNHCGKYWLFTGLGARGLLFHGWLGKLMARAVLSCDESLIPSELTSWKCERHYNHR